MDWMTAFWIFWSEQRSFACWDMISRCISHFLAWSSFQSGRTERASSRYGSCVGTFTWTHLTRLKRLLLGIIWSLISLPMYHDSIFLHSISTVQPKQIPRSWFKFGNTIWRLVIQTKLCQPRRNSRASIQNRSNSISGDNTVTSKQFWPSTCIDAAPLRPQLYFNKHLWPCRFVQRVRKNPEFESQNGKVANFYGLHFVWKYYVKTLKSENYIKIQNTIIPWTM